MSLPVTGFVTGLPRELNKKHTNKAKKSKHQKYAIS
jgi:hypothetical protein